MRIASEQRQSSETTKMITRYTWQICDFLCRGLIGSQFLFFSSETPNLSSSPGNVDWFRVESINQQTSAHRKRNRFYRDAGCMAFASHLNRRLLCWCWWRSGTMFTLLYSRVNRVRLRDLFTPISHERKWLLYYAKWLWHICTTI